MVHLDGLDELDVAHDGEFHPGISHEVPVPRYTS
jgi:hypothetical protein